MFRNNLWFDRTRAKKFRSEPVDIEVADFLAGSDGWAVAESKLALLDLLKALDQLSPLGAERRRRITWDILRAHPSDP
jgi:hypothetical protein